MAEESTTDPAIMRICYEYKISKTQLFNQFSLEDIMDTLEQFEKNAEFEYQYNKEIESKYNNGK